MSFTKRSLEILKSFRNRQNIQSVADIFDITYNIIRNNFFKPFWRVGYLTRIERGYYVISEKGEEKIKNIKEDKELHSLRYNNRDTVIKHIQNKNIYYK